MRPVALAVLLLLLPLATTVPAAPTVKSVPEWNVGDSWQYQVTTRTGTLTTLGDLTVKVVADGEVRIGNATVRAYTLSERLKPWTPANASKRLPEEASWGQTYTLVNTTVIVERSTLCILSTDSIRSTVHGADVTNDSESVVYSPSDGRMRFPLTAGSAWNVTFNMTRTRRYPFHTFTDNLTQTRSYECLGQVNVTYREKGFHIRCAIEGSASTIDYWYSSRYRADVRREEFDASTGTYRSLELLKHSSVQPPEPFRNPQTVLALLFGLAALGLMAGALLLRFLPGVMQRRKERRLEKGSAARTAGGQVPRPAAPPGRGVAGGPRRSPPAGPPGRAGTARRGPGRSL